MSSGSLPRIEDLWSQIHSGDHVIDGDGGEDIATWLTLHRERSRRIGRTGSRLQKWRRRATNWLNGLPVRDLRDDGIDSASILEELAAIRNFHGGSLKNKRGFFHRARKIFNKPKKWVKNKLRNNQEQPTNEPDSHAGFISIKNTRTIRVPSNLPVGQDEGMALLIDTDEDLQILTISNEINTAKYTLFNFIPKNVLEQLRRVANIYFLAIILLQCIPAISNYNPVLAALPLILIMAVTGIKDGIEDWRRHQQDREVNYALCRILHRPENLDTKISNMRRTTRLARFRDTINAAADDALHLLLRFIVWCRGSGDASPIKSGRRRLNTPGANESADDFAQYPPSDILDSPGGSRWKRIYWRDIRVGDIVMLGNNEMIPADILVISTSESDGICFVETKNLDGETNLKIRRCPRETAWVTNAEDASLLNVCVEVDKPTSHLHHFSGRLIIQKNVASPILTPDTFQINNLNSSRSRIESIHSQASNFKYNSKYNEPGFLGEDKLIVPLNLDSLLLRGCIIRNTDYVIGLVAFTGPHTKIMLNSGLTPSKRTRIERQMNPQVILNFVLLAVICLTCAIVQAQFAITKGMAPFWPSSFLDSGRLLRSAVFLGFLTFWSSIILFQTLVPISMYVCVEMVKTLQAYFINNDYQIYDPVSNRRAIPRAWNLADDLGQIEYLFSDKTGTLTENVMEFRQCSIGGQIYGHIQGECHPQCLVCNMPDQISSTENSNYTNCVCTKFSAVNNLIYRANGVTGDDDDDNSNRRICPVFWSHLEIEMSKKLKTIIKDYDRPSSYDFCDPSIISNIRNQAVIDFFTVIILCHTVLVDERAILSNQSQTPETPNSSPLSDENQQSGNLNSESPSLLSNSEMRYVPLQYKAQSPDEAAMVTAARDLGFIFLGRSRDTITASFLGKKEEIMILNVIEFTSDRKRMSVIVKRENGTIELLIKGADSIIYDRVQKNNLENSSIQTNKDLEAITKIHLSKFAEEGFRTLCIAKRILDEKFYNDWANRYGEALANDYPTDSLVDEIETNLTLIGATAIEDRLQEGVSECIRILKTSGIKVWVLTGDKLETAVNIGFSCGLLQKEMLLLVIQGESGEQAETQLRMAFDRVFAFNQTYNHAANLPQQDISMSGSEPSGHMNYNPNGEENMETKILKSPDSKKIDVFDGQITGDEVNLQMSPSELQSSRNDMKFCVQDRNERFALIIDGITLKHALERAECRRLLLEISGQTESVICCRVSPLQKAKVVELVRHSRNAITMAIGDGANDVSMIQAADIGVGIAGQEGMQAVMASDYAIAQFRFLTRLLLVHGHWSYLRVGEVTLLSMYKNLAFVVLLFWYQFYCGFTAQYVYDYMYLLYFNLFFSTAPLLVVGFLDRDLFANHLLSVPPVYRRGIQQSAYSLKLFLLYLLDAVYQSAACFFLPLFAYQDTIVSSRGHPETQSTLGNVMALAIITTTNLYIAVNVYSWTITFTLGLLLSISTTFAFLIAYALVPSENLYGSLRIFGEPIFYLSFALSIIVAILPRILIKYVQTQFYPTDVDIVRENYKWAIDKAALERTVASENVLSHFEKPEDLSLDQDTDVIDEIVERLKMDPLPSPVFDKYESQTKGQPTPEKDTKELVKNWRDRFLRKSLAFFNMRTEAFEEMGGYAFSQEEGMAKVIGMNRQTQRPVSVSNHEIATNNNTLRISSHTDKGAPCNDENKNFEIPGIIKNHSTNTSATNSTGGRHFWNRRDKGVCKDRK